MIWESERGIGILRIPPVSGICVHGDVILRELVRRGGKNLRKTTRDPSPRTSAQDDKINMQTNFRNALAFNHGDS